MKTFLSLAFALLCLSAKAAPNTYTLNYSTAANLSCTAGDTLKFYGNGNDHYMVAVNSITVIHSSSVPSAPYYIGKYVVTASDTAYTIGKMSEGQKSGKLTVSAATSLYTYPDFSKTDAYPNPSTGMLTFTAVADQQAELWSADGRHLMSIAASKGTNTIDLSRLSAGVYLMRADGIIYRIIRE